jgi:hypothetical protein
LVARLTKCYALCSRLIADVRERMRAARKIPVVFAVVAASFALGAWTAIVRGWGTTNVTATIVNEGSEVASVTIRFKSCGAVGSVASGRLEPGSTQRLRYNVCGEAGYSVTAVFANGRSLSSSDGYVESGYGTTERIKNDAIVTTQSLYAL